LEHVRDFVTEVLGDNELTDSFAAHAAAIQQYAEADDWNFWGDLSLESQSDPDNWNAGGRNPLLSLLEMRRLSVLEQLEMHDAGTFPEQEWGPNDYCVHWDAEPSEPDFDNIDCANNCAESQPCFSDGCTAYFDEETGFSGPYVGCNVAAEYVGELAKRARPFEHPQGATTRNIRIVVTLCDRQVSRRITTPCLC